MTFAEPYSDWITLQELAEVSRQSEKTARRRTSSGYPKAVISIDRREVDGKPGILIDPRSLTLDEQQRLKQRRRPQISKEVEKNTRPACSPCTAARSLLDSVQSGLFPRTEFDEAIEEARQKLPRSQFSVAMKRFKAIQPTFDHDFRTLGFENKGDYEREVSRGIGVSQRQFRRWQKEFREVNREAGLSEALVALADERPGPQRGTADLDKSMKAFLLDCWINKRLTRRQACNALRRYLEEKQRGCGAAWAYEIPSDSTICGYIDAPEPHGLGGDPRLLQGGPKVLKAA